jgi:hemolysin III
MTAYEALEISANAVRTRLQRWEMRVDGAIHGVAIVAALFGAIILVLFTRHRGDLEDVIAVAIYSAGLLAMFGCSAAYNLGRFTRYGDWLRGLDQVAILLMIAGTYTPFTVMDLQGAWSWSFTSVIWSLAIVGVLLRLLWWRLFARLSIAIYLALGWCGIVAILPLVDALHPATLILLLIGGALYTIGLIFHFWERLPFQTAIWHLFVVAAAAVHFAAVTVSIATLSGSL